MLLLIHSDALRRRHTADNPPPFPTYFPEQDPEIQLTDAYDKEIHHYADPTITFVETEDEKKVIRTGAKLAKVRTKK